MSSIDAPPAPELTYGAYFIGVTVALALYGVVLVQVVQYFKTFPRDSWGLKATVLLMICSETINSGLQAYTCYFFLVLRRGDTSPLEKTPWTLVAPIAFNTFAGSILQTFFARRVWIMSNHNWILTGLVLLLSATQLALGWALAFLALLYPVAAEVTRYAFLNIPAFVTTAAADLVIACSLVYFLQIRKTGHAPTNTLVNRLIFMTINNGALPSALAFAALVAVLVAPMSMIPYAMCSILAKSYAVTLVVSLNSRKQSRKSLSCRPLSSRAVAGIGTSSGTPASNSESYKLQHQSCNSFSGITITKEVTVSQA